MKYINHVTLNTGHVRKTYPKEIDKKIFFSLNRIWKESLTKDGAELFDGYVLRSTAVQYATLGTVFASDGAPILTVAAVRQDDGEIWKHLHGTHVDMAGPLVTRPDQPAETPYIADRLEMGAIVHIDAMEWTGDFSRCFGWIVLDPRKIR